MDCLQPAVPAVTGICTPELDTRHSLGLADAKRRDTSDVVLSQLWFVLACGIEDALETLLIYNDLPSPRDFSTNNAKNEKKPCDSVH